MISFGHFCTETISPESALRHQMISRPVGEMQRRRELMVAYAREHPEANQQVLSSKFGIPLPDVSLVLRTHDIKVKGAPPLTEHPAYKTIVDLFKRGFNAREIQQKTGVGPQWIRAIGIQSGTKRVYTTADREEILKRVKRGDVILQIAKDYKTTPGNINNMAQRAGILEDPRLKTVNRKEVYGDVKNVIPAIGKNAKFSNFKYKLLNRAFEFKSLDKVYASVAKYPDTVNLLSFPRLYAFEDTLTKTLGKPLNIWVAERAEPGFNYVPPAVKFAEHYPYNKVYLPARYIEGSNSYKPFTRAPKLELLLNREVDFGLVDPKRKCLNQHGLYELPKRLDIIDLDYVVSFNAAVAMTTLQAWRRLGQTGLMLITHSIPSSRSTSTQIGAHLKKVEAGKVDLRRIPNVLGHGDELTKEPISYIFKPSVEHANEFGIFSNIDEYTNIVNNVAIEYGQLLPNSQLKFVNMYRGGETNSSGTYMVRLAFRKIS